MSGPRQPVILKLLFVFLILVFSCLNIRIGWAAPTTIRISEEAVAGVVKVKTEDWLKRLNRQREEFEQKYGTKFGLVLNYTQQVILRDKNNAGTSRAMWYLSLAVEQKLWPGAKLYAEFDVDKNKGIDKFFSPYSDFNNNTGENKNIYLPRVYLEQELFQDRAYLAGGKLDLSDWFDVNLVANSADEQFLATALVNNYVIPFPSKGIGAMAAFTPYEWFYYQIGAATAKASYTKTGLTDAFNSTLFLSELGVSPKIFGLAGNYRFLYYFLHRKYALILDESQDKRNQAGFGLSFDQQITPKITLFTRYGFASEKVNDIQYSWSAGGQIIGLFPHRKEDCFAVAVAQSILGKDAREYYGEDITATRETILEAYYSFRINESLVISPDLQVMLEPGADKESVNPIIASVRFLLAF